MSSVPLFAPKAWPQIALAGSASVLLILVLIGTRDPAAILAVAVLPIVLWIAITRPVQLSLLFIAFSYFRLHEAYPMLLPLKLPLALAILSLTALAWHMVLAHTAKPFWSRELKLFAVFFALASLGLVFAIDRPLAIEFWTSTFWKIGIMTLGIAWLVRTPTDFTRTSSTMLIAGSLVAVVAIYNSMHGIGLVEGTRVTIARDLQSPLGDPNDLSLVLLFPLGFAAAQLVCRQGALSTTLALIALPLLLAAIILTQSRGGLIGVVATYAVIGFHVLKSRRLLMIAGAALVVALVHAMSLADRVSGGAAELQRSGIDESSRGRLDAWRAALNMAAKRPLTGVGLQNFTENYFFFTDNWKGRNIAVHSTWFGVLAETGVPGLLAFVAMVVAAFRSSLRSLRALAQVGASAPARSLALALVAGLAGFCAAGTFLTQGFTWPIYILIALAAALGRYRDEHALDPSAQEQGNRVLAWAPITRRLERQGREP
jgi:probable O-glycosylation ligase (exosortase A-associated)